MVTILEYEMEQFRQKAEDMDVFCFGAGKYFRNFITQNPTIHVTGVVDNYYKEEAVEIENVRYPLYSVEGFCNIYHKKCVLVITVSFFEEIIDQLDEIKKLDDMFCFIPMIYNQSIVTEEEQKARWQSKMRALLSERAYKKGQKENQREGNYYQIWEYYDRSNIGGSKARTDISQVLADCGYMFEKIHCSGVVRDSALWQKAQIEWENFNERMKEDAVLFMQHPAPTETVLPRQVLDQMKRQKHARFIVLVHEVESLRKSYDSPCRQEEFETMLSVGDVFIVHNEVMRQFYIEKGIAPDNVISLGIFDYLDENANVEKAFEKSVTIAANLDLNKSPYLMQLKKLGNLKFHLYGPNYKEDISRGTENIDYHGSLPSERIPQKLDRGFGLVWDGDSIETCSGGTGEYLKYNNPHKLSLYLSAGLPVIIWSGAAQAQFVRKNEVGICVGSLQEAEEILGDMNESQYYFYVRNAQNLSQKLKEGEYIREALKKAEGQLCRKYQ